MKIGKPICDTDVQIRITMGEQTIEDNQIEPCFTKFSYTITDETIYIHEGNQELWLVTGRLERIKFDDEKMNTVCAPNVSLFDLCGHLSSTPNTYELSVEHADGKTINIRTVMFYDYGCTYEVGCECLEEVYFTGDMDYKNIMK